MEQNVSFSAEQVMDILYSYIIGLVILYVLLIAFAIYKWFRVEKRFDYRLIGVGAAMAAPLIGSIILIILSARRKTE